MTLSRDPDWTRRRRRLERLRTDHLHAAELLAFYGDVLALQEPIHARARKSRWLEAVAAVDGRTPHLRLERLPDRLRKRDFPRFVRSVPASATEVLKAIASRLTAEPAAMSDLLAVVLDRKPVDAVASRVDCDAAALAFFPRAFLQPVAEALAAPAHAGPGNGAVDAPPDRGSGSESARAACPCCGAAPVAAVLRDEPEIKGRRTLLCSLCLSEWTFPRTRCPACGEERAEKRPHHVSESWPHIRLEECGSCRTYIKAIDLREVGLAVPVVTSLRRSSSISGPGSRGCRSCRRTCSGCSPPRPGAGNDGRTGCSTSSRSMPANA